MTILEDRPETYEDLKVCWYESGTLVCGSVKVLDYYQMIKNSMNQEPYYGDIDLFGF